MATKTGVSREGFTIAQLETGPRQIRSASGTTFRMTCDDGLELAVQVRDKPHVHPVRTRRGRWETVQADPLAAPFRADGPAPSHHVELRTLVVEPGDRVEVHGELRDDTHLLASRLVKLDAATEARQARLRAPLTPSPLGPPIAAFIVLALLVASRVGLAYRAHAPSRELITDGVGALVIALALHLHRTRGVRFIALLAQPKGANDVHDPDPKWGYASSSYASNVWTVSLISGAVLFGATLLAEHVGTTDFGPQGAYPYAIWCGLVAAILWLTHHRSRRFAKIMLDAPTIGTGDPAGTWGAAEGAIAATTPKRVFGVDVVATFTTEQKFVEDLSTAAYQVTETREIDATSAASVPFEVVTAGKVWKVDPAKATWASAGRIVPREQTGDRGGYTVAFVEVLPAASQVLVVGRAGRPRLHLAGRGLALPLSVRRRRRRARRATRVSQVVARDRGAAARRARVVVPAVTAISIFANVAWIPACYRPA